MKAASARDLMEIADLTHSAAGAYLVEHRMHSAASAHLVEQHMHCAAGARVVEQRMHGAPAPMKAGA